MSTAFFWSDNSIDLLYFKKNMAHTPTLRHGTSCHISLANV